MSFHAWETYDLESKEQQQSLSKQEISYRVDSARHDYSGLMEARDQRWSSVVEGVLSWYLGDLAQQVKRS